jgi:hypothetical protein
VIPQPKRPEPIEWRGEHLYRHDRGGALYVGSVVHNRVLRRYVAWSRGRWLGGFDGREGARERLEEYAREEA